MSYLLFMDESGHDHKKTPYEIHGGIALDCKKIFSVVREIMDMEKEVFGCQLKEYKVELKGTKLLKKIHLSGLKIIQTNLQKMRDRGMSVVF